MTGFKCNIPVLLGILSLCFLLGACSPRPQLRSTPCAMEEAFSADPTDCSAYYQCSAGQGFKLKCPTGLHWNNALKACDWPDFAGCMLEPHDENGDTEKGSAEQEDDEEEDSGDSSVSSNEEGTSEESVEGSDSSSSSSSSENVMCEAIKNHPECPENDIEGSKYFPHQDPSHFYHCSHGVAHCKACPAGLVWNQKCLVCDWPEISLCHGHESGGNDDSAPKPPEGEDEDDKDSESDDEDKDDGKDKEDSEDKEDGEDKEDSEDKDDGKDKEDSEDKEDGKDKEDSEDKEDSKESEDSKDSEDSEDKEDGKDKEDSKPEDEDNDSSGCAEGKDRVECPSVDDTRPIFFPDPEDPHSYFQCDHGRLHCKRCAGDLVWNQEHVVCDWDNRST